MQNWCFTVVKVSSLSANIRLLSKILNTYQHHIQHSWTAQWSIADLKSFIHVIYLLEEQFSILFTHLLLVSFEEIYCKSNSKWHSSRWKVLLCVALCHVSISHRKPANKKNPCSPIAAVSFFRATWATLASCEGMYVLLIFNKESFTNMFYFWLFWKILESFSICVCTIIVDGLYFWRSQKIHF